MWLAGSSRSFANMRVEILTNVPVPEAALPAPENRALKTFLASLNSEDSLLRAAPFAPPTAPADAAGTQAYAGGVVLFFADDAHNGDRGLYYALLEKLVELLKGAGSADTVELHLGLGLRTESSAPAPKHALVLELVSRGATPEQAELRWGLGVAHLQQALLFTSRLLRQQLSGRNA